MIEICHQSTSMCIWAARSLIMMCHLPFLPCLIFSSKEGISLSNNHTFIQETLMWHDYYLSHHTHRHIGHSSVPETLWSKPITANEQNQLTKLVECNHIHDVLMSKEFFFVENHANNQQYGRVLKSIKLFLDSQKFWLQKTRPILSLSLMIEDHQIPKKNQRQWIHIEPC